MDEIMPPVRIGLTDEIDTRQIYQIGIDDNIDLTLPVLSFNWYVYLNTNETIDMGMIWIDVDPSTTIETIISGFPYRFKNQLIFY